MKTIVQMYMEKRGSLIGGAVGVLAGHQTEGPEHSVIGRVGTGGIGGALAGALGRRYLGMPLLGQVVGGAVGGSIAAKLFNVVNDKVHAKS